MSKEPPIENPFGLKLQQLHIEKVPIKPQMKFRLHIRNSVPKYCENYCISYKKNALLLIVIDESATNVKKLSVTLWIFQRKLFSLNRLFCVSINETKGNIHYLIINGNFWNYFQQHFFWTQIVQTQNTALL